MDGTELYVPGPLDLAGDVVLLLAWLAFLAGLMVYPAPRGATLGPLRIAAGWTGLVVVIHVLWDFGAFGRYPRWGDLQPSWVVTLTNALQWGSILGYILLAVGAWLAGRSLVRVWRQEPASAEPR